MNDNEHVALLAGMVDSQMRKTLAGSDGLQHNRTDYRRFLAGNPPPHQQNQGYNQYAIPQNYPQQSAPQYHNPVDPYIPEGVLPTGNITQLPIPQNAPPQYYQQPIHPQPHIQDTNGFSVPDYSNKPSSKYLEDEQEFRDALIKEIKSQKKSINKLHKEVESLTLLLKTYLPPTPPIFEPITLDANTDK